METSRRKNFLERQAQRLERRLVQLKAETGRFSQWRLISFLAIFVVGAPIFFTQGPAFFWPVALILSATFIVVVIVHRRYLLGLARYELAHKRKLTQLARQAVEWHSLPAYAGPFPDPEHPFASDMDLAGEHSFHQLISSARTRGGHARLYRWLSHSSPSLHEARKRQKTVQELQPLTVLRQRIVLAADLAADESGQWDTEALLAWTQAGQDKGVYRRWLLIASLLAALNLTLFAINSLTDFPSIWPFTLLIYAAITFSQTRLLAPIFTEAASLQDAFRQLTAIFSTLEKFSFAKTPNLAKLCLPFQNQGQRPSDYLRRVAAVVNATGLRNNPFLWLFLNLIVPWDFYFAYRLSLVKEDVARQLPDWLDRYYQLEAYNSLAEYAYLNPDYSWPTIFESEAPQLATLSLGHPLLPRQDRVTNDFELHGNGSMALITGSNMSGKSTFLRTIGLNLAVAMAGGPVVAEQFQSSMLRLFSSIKLSDSVTDGISYFYAEVRRLRALLDAIEDKDSDQPVFFLIDEIFRGTNNEERRLGSEALIRALNLTSAAGLISTHDLGLVSLADEIDNLQNYHFRDDIEGETMLFDFQLRLGPSPTTNALHIMRTAGLPVPQLESAPGQ